MKTFVLTAGFVALVMNAGAPQARAGIVPKTGTAEVQTVPAALPTAQPDTPQRIVLKKDTPVRLMVMTEVSTKVDMAGQRVRFAVDEPVMVDGKVAIPDGTPAWGEVISAERSGNVGKGGALTARVLYIDIAGTHLAINGETAAKGHNAGGETALAVIGLGPLGLLAKGNNAKIKAGERMTAFVTEDTLLPPAPGATKPS